MLDYFEEFYCSATVDSTGSVRFPPRFPRLGSTPAAGVTGNAEEVFRSFDASVASQSFLAHLFTSRDSLFGSKDTLHFKSLDTLSPSADDKNPGVLPGIYESSEWLSGYQRSHADIDYTRNIFPDTTMTVPAEQAEDSYSKCLARYREALVNPMARVQITTVVEQDKKTKNKKKKCPNRCVDPEKKVYVEVTDPDILCGRGGRSNNHKGNEKYRATIEAAKEEYRTMAKYEKTILSHTIVEDMNKQGRRFLKRDTNGLYFEIPKMAARRKAGQALREENTPEARATKRQRYRK